MSLFVPLWLSQAMCKGLSGVLISPFTLEGAVRLLPSSPTAYARRLAYSVKSLASSATLSVPELVVEITLFDENTWSVLSFVRASAGCCEGHELLSMPNVSYRMSAEHFDR